MTKRALLLIVLLIALGGVSALLVSQPVEARVCVQCPVIEDPVCPPCYELIPGTCTHCAYCKRIPHCKPD